ncbi:MAG TPA: SDR family NAD(P)-dependent oxidoreductase [Bryobacteraceae bacterium]|nr:SDR family NAD(P)-dependent oxidoreductase [Bryobacteraceae bacterium]
MERRLKGKTAIVTGANRGIGKAIAQRLAAEGCRLVLCARDSRLLQETQREIEGAGGPAASLALDLRTPEAAVRLTEFAKKTFGQIDIVVNNAGATRRGEFLELTDADWEDGFALKFFGAVRLTRAAWPHLRASAGSVVNISGVGGRMPGAQFAIGGSVNAAMLSFTKAMADVGIRDGVRVNAINPGNVRTARYLQRLEQVAREHGVDTASAEKKIIAGAQVTRIGEPEDIAALVAFVVSAEGSFLQGALIDMDGGATKVM